MTKRNSNPPPDHPKLQQKPALIGRCYITVKWAMRQATHASGLRRRFAEIAEELKRLAPEECVDEEGEG